jgi:hypothetical protein
MMVFLNGFRNLGCSILDHGEDGWLFSAGMPNQNFVEEPETLDGSSKIKTLNCLEASYVNEGQYSENEAI